MTSRARYSLIATGIVAFILLTPLFYLFVRGLKYDSKSHRFVATGTFSVKTNPSGATLFLNGKDSGKTNANVRFLTPGDYDIRISKEGYFTWSKRLNIREQYVTWANPNLPSVALFYAEAPKEKVAEGITNFYLGNKRLIALTKDRILVSDPNTPQQSSELALPKQFEHLDILASTDENYFLISNPEFFALLDVRANAFSDITDLVLKQAAFSPAVNFQASEELLKFSDNNELYQLRSGTIYKLDWRKKTKDIILDKVLAFYPNSSGIYVISIENDGTNIRRELARTDGDHNATTLLKDLPPFKSADIYLSDRNQLFILGDGALYDLSNGINRVANDVRSISIDNDNKKMLYSSNNEINVYDLNTGLTSLVTRSSQQIQNPVALHKLGWVFFLSDKRLQNIEIDSRDHQNNYTFSAVSDNAKFYIDNDSKYIFLLNDGLLSKFQIR